MADQTWRTRAACRGADTDLFFPTETGEHGGQAQAICLSCPVADACLETHLGENIGIWGGTTESQRRRIRAGRRAVA